MYEPCGLAMQSRRAILSSASLNKKSANLLSSPQNLAHSLSEFADDDLPSIGEVNCTSGTTESIRKSLGLVWSGDFDSLKQFVADSLKLKGVWSQPGGDKKVFATEDVSIIWRKNKNLLFIEGAKANQLKREVCRYMCGHSSETADTYLTEITELKHGQLSNGEAIKRLSDKCEYMGTVISQMSKNIESFVEETSDRYVELIKFICWACKCRVVCDAKDDDVLSL